MAGLASLGLGLGGTWMAKEKMEQTKQNIAVFPENCTQLLLLPTFLQMGLTWFQCSFMLDPSQDCNFFFPFLLHDQHTDPIPFCVLVCFRVCVFFSTPISTNIAGRQTTNVKIIHLQRCTGDYVTMQNTTCSVISATK